jgi:hypothetical protein
MTPERERAIQDAEAEIDWRLSVPANRHADLTDDEIDAAIRSTLAELETTWQAAWAVASVALSSVARQRRRFALR